MLASQSPRRRELLRRSGLDFCCLVPGVDEEIDDSPNAEEAAMAVAARKARAAVEMLGGDDSCPVLGCDTMVVLGGGEPESGPESASRGGSTPGAGPDPAPALEPEPALEAEPELEPEPEQILGKPADADDARRMLRALSGRTHRVISGVCIIEDGREHCFAETTRVVFKSLEPQQIEAYINSGEPFDKAGAYGIQGGAGEFVEALEGDYDNVVGLPVARVMEVLSNMDEKTVGKDEVRKQMKAVRKAIPAEERAEASAQVCRLLMETPEFEKAKVIAAYCAFGSELAFDYMAENFPTDKVLAVPVTMPDHHMEFVAVEPEQILPGRGTLPFLTDPAKLADVPDDARVIAADEIDIMLAPGLAFDDEGYRIGYGGGYYDVYMKREGFHAMRFGTFFDQQHYNGSLPHDENDVPLPAIITPGGVKRFS